MNAVVAADGVTGGDPEFEIFVSRGKTELEFPPPLARIGEFVHAVDFVVTGLRCDPEIGAV